MPGRDEHSAATRVAILEYRRLLRQTISIWLAAHEGVDLVGIAANTRALHELCEDKPVDTVVIGLPTEAAKRHRIEHDVAEFADVHRNIRLIAWAEGKTTAPPFQTVVPATAGLNDFLRAIVSAEARESPEMPVSVEMGQSSGPLTPREAEVLNLVGQGSTTLDISEQLGISRSTVANHKERIFSKLHANNQAHAVARAVNLGLISPIREEDPRQVGCVAIQHPGESSRRDEDHQRTTGSSVDAGRVQCRLRGT
jgi:DNA-binding NarL/FixJ family response regulator